jgi:hypothetical protein
LLVRWLRGAAALEGMTLMFQLEVAERITAAPATSAYGRLAVLAQWRCRCDLLLRLPPGAFSPPPKVQLGLAVGALETDEFKRQSAEMAARWGAPTPLYPENCNHFSLLEGLRGAGPLLDLAVRTAAAQS